MGTVVRNENLLVLKTLILIFIGSFLLLGCSSSRTPYREQFKEFSSSLRSDGIKTTELKIESHNLYFEIHSLKGEDIDVSPLDNLSDPPPNHPAILKVMKRVGLITGRLTLRYRQHFIPEDSSDTTKPPTIHASLPDKRGKEFVVFKINRNAIRLAENIRNMTQRQKGKLFQKILRFNTSLQPGKALKKALEKEYGTTMRKLII